MRNDDILILILTCIHKLGILWLRLRVVMDTGVVDFKSLDGYVDGYQHLQDQA